MRFTLKPITRDDARAISGWRYEEPYSIYDGDPSSVEALLQPRYAYHSVYDEHGVLVGYFCFGVDAQVAAGRRLGLYEIERGEKDPSSRVLESIASGLDIEVSELLVRIASALEPASVVPVTDSLAA